MVLHTTDALILRTYKLGEADRIVVFLTRDRGKKRGVAKNARQSRRRFGGALEPMTCGRVQYSERERRDLVEKAMFGGLAFLVGGKMSVGILGDQLIARVTAARVAEAEKQPHARPFDFTGKPMKGWLYVAPDGVEDDGALARWVEWGLEAAAEKAKAKKAAAPKPPAAKAKKKPR